MTDRAEHDSDAAIQARLADRLAELDRTFDLGRVESQDLRDQLARDKAGFTALAQDQAVRDRRVAEVHRLRGLLEAVPAAAKAAPRWAVALEFALIDLAGAATAGPLDLSEVTTVIEWLVREGGSADAPQAP